MKLSDYAQMAKDKNISKLIQNHIYSITYRDDNSIHVQGNLKDVKIDDLDYLMENAERMSYADSEYYAIVVDGVRFVLHEEKK